MTEQLLTIPCELTDVQRNSYGITKIKAESQEKINPELTARMMDNVGKYGYLCFLAGERPPDAEDVADLPELAYEKAEKTHSQRLRAVLFVAWKKATEKGLTVETADNFYRRKMESLIEAEKAKIDPV